MLEQNIIKKGYIYKLIFQLDFGEINDNKIYKVEAIRDSGVYSKESLEGHLPDLYYLVSSKNYPKAENT